MTNTSPPKQMSPEDQKNLICGILTDFATDPDVEVLFAYLRHCGLPILALRSAEDIIPAFLGLYRLRTGQYDVDRACEDLRWWPPIAARIAELEAEARTKPSDMEAGRGASPSQVGAAAEILPDDL
ncbi:hypothetical protein [uncultured Paracoccus sp.]|uniref:hypothetical protein n=1 Tax=uncultured Paracoccus sp. TaxID=189685 RepID=UPI00261025EE|nr:hypothetical protein [uncultured Paracoccus sp.]